jgi:competence protein ComEC
MKNYPLIKYVLAFIVGIISTDLFFISLNTFLLISISLLITVIVFSVVKHVKFSFALWLLLIIFTGNIYYSLRIDNKSVYPFAADKISGANLYGTITGINLIQKDKIKLIVHSDSVMVKDSTHLLQNYFLCNITEKKHKKLKRLYNELGIGYKIKISGTIRKGRERRNPGEFDYYKYLQSKKICGLFYVKGAKNVLLFKQKTSKRFYNVIFKIRKNIAEQIEMLHNQRTSALLKGLLLADRSDIDYNIKLSFINSGVIHVLAVSGLHVGFILLIFIFLFSRIPLFPRTILTIIGLIVFLAITNSPPSVFRATTMAVIMLLIFLSNRKYNSVNALSIAALILLLLNPDEIFNPGFQLSFSAVLSIVILYPVLRNKIKVKNSLLRNILLFFAVSFSAQLGTLPFTLIYFHKLSLISLIANLFVIPIIGIIVGLAVITLFVSLLSNTLALFFASANMLAVDILFAVVNYSGNLKFSYLFIPNFSLLDGIIFYLFLALLLFSIKYFTNKIALAILFILVLANLFFYLQLDNKKLLPDGKLSVLMIDVGQGDGILLKFPNNKTALIDAGNASNSFDNGERVIAPLLKLLGIAKVDYGFISHVDSDHYKGFIYLIKAGLIKEIYKPRLDTSLKKDLRLEALIRKLKIPLHYYGKSKKIFGNLRLYILNDTANTAYNSLDMNNRSGIIKILYGNNSFLFVGDAEHPAENLLIKTYNNFIDVDVLKVGHHGSKTSSSEKFIAAVTPSVGLISVGAKNKFGHPAQIVLNRLKQNKVKCYRTDLEGALLLQSNGEMIEKINWRNY